MRHYILLLSFCFLFTSCKKEASDFEMNIVYTVESEVEYLKIDSITYVGSNYQTATITEVTLPWSKNLSFNTKDSLALSIYGEAANINASAILNTVDIKITGNYSENNKNTSINQLRSIEPLNDTINLNHTISFE